VTEHQAALKPGFYWVRLDYDSAVVVAWWRDIYEDGSAFEWSVPGYAGGAESLGINIVSPRLRPPSENKVEALAEEDAT
jgi:hypothetical protein